MTGIALNKRIRRAVAAATVATVAVLVTASPASAHHDPDELMRVESTLGAGTDAVQQGLPVGLIAVMTILATLAVIATRTRQLGAFARRQLRPTRRLIAITTVAAAFAGPLAPGPAGAASLLLPDLISDEPDPFGGVEINTYTGTDRLILRFDGYVTNVGDGPLEVSGNPQITNSADPNAVHQRALDSDGNWNIVATPLVQFETADGHNHFHLMEIGRYSLWNQDQTAEAAPGQKVGFCLYDIERAEAEDYSGPQNSLTYSGSVTQFCDSGNPTTDSLVMGTSAGWRDVYGAYLTYQWIDVSETAPGVYYLANEADPYNRVRESDESNNEIGFASEPSIIPGYNALPIAAETLGAPVDITLETEQFGSPGSRRFRIVTAPEHGTLDVTVGSTLSSAAVTYTPSPGYEGPDSFEYIAFDLGSAFPLNPTRAAASIDVGRVLVPAVEISGAPASLIAGTSADLSATVTDSDGDVSWSVEGVPGGDATVGTVGSDGLYIAPTTVPAGGSVTVRAALADDPSVYDGVDITIDPIPNNAPVVATPSDQASEVDDEISLLVEAHDPDGEGFTFSAVGLPSGLTIHPNTGVISGVVSEVGTHDVTVTVDDGTDAAVVEFGWTVEQPAPDPGGGGTTGPTVTPAPFLDVSEDSFAASDIDLLFALGITTGTSAATFSPDLGLRRDHMAAFLARTWNVLGQECSDQTTPFTDIAPSFAAPAIGCLYQEGITTGTTATTFDPAREVTRQEMAAFLARVWRALGNSCSTDPTPFLDVDLMSYAKPEIDCIYHLGLTTGTSPTEFSPRDVVTREQIAAFIGRLYRLVQVQRSTASR